MILQSKKTSHTQDVIPENGVAQFRTDVVLQVKFLTEQRLSLRRRGTDAIRTVIFSIPGTRGNLPEFAP
jgi:hypothetical protein